MPELSNFSANPRASSNKARPDKVTFGLSGLIMIIIISGLVLLGVAASLNAKQALAQTQTQTGPTPPPTPPSLTRPNLHFYLVDEADRPQAGISMKLYKGVVKNVGTNDTYTDVELLLSGTSDGAGRIDLDVASIIYGIYYLELRESDGAVILRDDPNLPPTGPIGQPDPKTRYMTILDLNSGAVVYVNRYRLKPLVKPVQIRADSASASASNLLARRTVYRPDTQSWIYYPNSEQGLGPAPGASPSATVTGANPNANTNNPPSTGTPGTGAGGNGQTPSGLGRIPETPNPATLATPVAIGLTNVPSYPNPNPNSGSGNGGNTAPPTPTLECRACRPVAGGNGNSGAAVPGSTSNTGTGNNGQAQAQPQLTNEAATVQAQLTAGTFGQVQGVNAQGTPQSYPGGAVRSRDEAGGLVSPAVTNTNTNANSSSVSGSGSSPTAGGSVQAQASLTASASAKGSARPAAVVGVIVGVDPTTTPANANDSAGNNSITQRAGSGIAGLSQNQQTKANDNTPGLIVIVVVVVIVALGALVWFLLSRNRRTTENGDESER